MGPNAMYPLKCCSMMDDLDRLRCDTNACATDFKRGQELAHRGFNMGVLKALVFGVVLIKYYWRRV